ncbi:hypothetical protein ABZV58_33025 [Nocardia sp. NPDC004654]|uniref:hypothetical protein n=1 Tax=Nocardia sp. NPDC004654 TaxID=3154776 RepID=UPI0033A28463
MNKLFRFTFRVGEPLTPQQANLVLPAVRAFLDQEGLPSYGQLTPTADGRWTMRGWTDDLDYDAFSARHGSEFVPWHESVEAAVGRIVKEANPASWASCDWFYSDDEDFYDE